MKVIVGLGNPGSKYENTRHNVGFDVIRCLANRHFFGRPSAKHHGEIAETQIDGQKVLLVCPTTFMNLSGQCVAPIVNFYKLPLEDLLIVCDDLNLPVGKLRLKGKGSSGGQNGLKDLISKLGSDVFPRLRIGIGPVPARWDTADYVLGKFHDEDKQLIEAGTKQAVQAVELWIKEGLSSAMNRFNYRPPKKPKKKKTPSAEPGEEKLSSQPDKEGDGQLNQPKEQQRKEQGDLPAPGQQRQTAQPQNNQPTDPRSFDEPVTE